MVEDIVALPNVAPLSVPMVLHLLNMENDVFAHEVRMEVVLIRQRLAELEARIAVVRKQVFRAIQEEYATGRGISVQWFRHILPILRAQEQQEPPGKPISLQSVKNWRESGAFHFNDRGEMNLDSAAAILVVAATDRRERHFLPSTIPPNEPLWWCLSQAPPTRSGKSAPILPCPIPLPHGLEPGTLLWSVWPSFAPDWLQATNGAIRFASLDRTSLERWDSTIHTDHISAALDGSPHLEQQMLQRLAQSTLLKLSVGRLGITPPTTLPLLWNAGQIWPGEVFSDGRNKSG